jgi:alpha-ribazole phosphatase
MDFGAWDGLSPAAVPPASLSAFQTDPDASPTRGRWSALVARVRAALAEGATGDTLIVTHAGAMRAALTVLCGFSYDQVWAFDLPYASLLSLRVWPGNPCQKTP